MNEPKKRRLLITCDGEHWFLRRYVSACHDLEHDERRYTADKPFGPKGGKRFNTLQELAAWAAAYLTDELYEGPL